MTMTKITNSSEWSRNCPDCGKVLYYSCKRNLKRAEENGVGCRNCKTMSESSRKKISNTLKGIKYGYHQRPNRKVKAENKPFNRECPMCKKILGYTKKCSYLASEKDNKICLSCSMTVHKKSWKHVITDDHIKKMRATKAGFTSWEEYKQKYPKKKAYINEVHKLTRKQPLHTLPNYSKLEENWGRMGVDGAYQIDHIVSIDKGWKDMIPAEEIANISNLQVMKWEDNLRKQ